MSISELAIVDVQSREDTRQTAINQVGIKGLKMPFKLLTAEHKLVHTVADLDMSVSLAPDLKGTHMSRFIEVIQAHEEPITALGLAKLLKMMQIRLGSESAYLTAKFPYFIEKTAPVSKTRSLLDYQVTLQGSLKGSMIQTGFTVVVPVTSLCPCSKEISEYGAHNQRSHVTISVEVIEHYAIEELIQLAESEASCEVYGLLKRSDEKYVTERAYENPKFVEDMVRDIAARLKSDPRVNYYRVESENFESIHNHSAYAVIEERK